MMNNGAPLDFIQLIKQGQNPQQLMMQILEQRAYSNPMYANLLTLAKSGNGKEIEMIARNMAKEKGIDYDEEFTTFKQKFGF